MELSRLSQENGWERLPAYIFISIVVHALVLLLLPYPIKPSKTAPIKVKLLTETKVEEIKKVRPPKRVDVGKVLSAVSGILEKEVENLPLASKVPLPMKLPKATVEERSFSMLEKELKAASDEGGAPIEFTPPSKVFIDPKSLPIVIPKGLSLKEEEKPERKGRLKKGILSFTGPVTERKLIYMPPPPKVVVKVDTKVHLKFWVEPDGSVIMVEIKRVDGDPSLGRKAMEYVKALRFNPVVSGVRVWGEVDVFFKRVR